MSFVERIEGQSTWAAGQSHDMMIRTPLLTSFSRLQFSLASLAERIAKAEEIIDREHEKGLLFRQVRGWKSRCRWWY